MQTTIDISDAAVSELCAGVAETILSEAGSSDKAPDRDFGELLFSAVQKAERQIARIGKHGPWCVFDGSDDYLTVCHCQFAGDFRCHGHFVCKPCHTAHLAIAEFLERMFAFPVVERADSRRVACSDQLHCAAGRVMNPTDSDSYDSIAERDLAFHLSAADPWGDADMFRGKILRAFRVSKFVAYQQLSAEIENQKHETMLRAIRRAVRWQKQQNRRDRILDLFAEQLRAEKVQSAVYRTVSRALSGAKQDDEG